LGLSHDFAVQELNPGALAIDLAVRTREAWWRGQQTMLERDRERLVFQRALTGAAAGVGSVLLVTGEAGIGKTTLIQGFRRAVSASTRVLTGACDDLLAPPTLGPLLEAVRGRPGPLADALQSGQPDKVFGAVVDELAGSQPTVLILEDVHWADDATLDVLRYLVPRLGPLGALLVLSLRNETRHRGGRLEQLLATVASTGAYRLALSPLSTAAVAQLAAEAGKDVSELMQLTGGNPFYVTEVLAGPAGDVPATVADSVLARLQDLSPSVRRGLEQLSVIPTEVELSLAEELLGDGFELLAEAEEVGMLKIRDATLSFRHELARRVIEASVPALRRRACHRNVVRVLRSRVPLDVPRLVHHAVLAADAEAVIESAPGAARDAARAGAHRQALTLFEAVLRYRALLAPADRAALLDEYAWELYNAHRFEEAVAAGRGAVAVYEQLGQTGACAEALLRLSRHIYMTGRTDEAARAVARVIELQDPSLPPAALANALTQQGALLALTGRSEQAVDALTRAQSLAREADQPELVALTLNYLGMAFCELEGPDGLHHLRHSLEMALRTGAHEVAARAYTNLGEMLYRFGRYEELARCIDEGLSFARERGFWSHAYNLELHRCLLLVRQSQWDEALTSLRRLVATVEEPGMLYVYSVPPLARLLARRGAPEAEAMLRSAWDRAVEQRSVLGIAYAGIAYVEWAWLAGRDADVAAVAAVVLGATRSRGSAPLRAEFLRYLDRTGGGHGEPADPAGPQPWTAGRMGDWRSAAGAWGRLGDTYERALELAESGREDRLLEALRLLDDLGAKPAAAWVRRRMKELGMGRVPRGPSPATRANPAGLTARQLDVLTLLARGLTNAEIAAGLFLSVRTVDHHVSAILDKLGVPTRREAAAAASRGLS
jgi:DNA-binding CsgD family transcriptional regulator/tetratricopeptide (TPR) repeat protein